MKQVWCNPDQDIIGTAINQQRKKNSSRKAVISNTLCELTLSCRMRFVVCDGLLK